jgi:hypothetical protein
MNIGTISKTSIYVSNEYDGSASFDKHDAPNIVDVVLGNNCVLRICLDSPASAGFNVALDRVLYGFAASYSCWVQKLYPRQFRSTAKSLIGCLLTERKIFCTDENDEPKAQVLIGLIKSIEPFDQPNSKLSKRFSNFFCYCFEEFSEQDLVSRWPATCVDCVNFVADCCKIKY